MNILFVNRYLFLKHGGGEVNDLNLCKQFATRGYSVSILSQFSKSDGYKKILEELEAYGIKLIDTQSPYLYTYSWKFGKVLGKFIRLFDEYLFYVKAKDKIRDQYDISFTTGRPISWKILSTKCKVTVYSVRGRLTKLLHKQLWRYDKIIFWGHCEYDNHDLHKSDLDYLSLPPAIDKDKFVQGCVSQTDKDQSCNAIKKLGYFGRVEPIKNLNFLLEAMTRLKSRGYELHVYGTGSQEKSLVKRAIDLGLSEVVWFHGKIDNSEVAEAMSNIDCVVLCSHMENYPIVLLEAAYSGKRTLAPNIGRIREIVTSTKSGYVYQPGKMDEFLEQLARLDTLSPGEIQYQFINDWTETSERIMKFVSGTN